MQNLVVTEIYNDNQITWSSELNQRNSYAKKINRMKIHLTENGKVDTI